MQNNIPEDLIEAKNLFEKSIDHTDHGRKTVYFEEALDILDGYLSDYPGTPYKSFIENIKLTYTKKLIEGLSSIREPDIDVNIFVRYFLIIETKANKEFRVICERFPELEEEYKSYIDYFGGFIVEDK